MKIGLGKRNNEYAQLVGRIDAPKAVWMALAASLANRIDGSIDAGNAPLDTLMAEWQALYDNGIVPQRPMRVVK